LSSLISLVAASPGLNTGATGYGREFRERLYGEWGIVDVNDCCSCAEYLVHSFMYTHVIIFITQKVHLGTLDDRIVPFFNSLIIHLIYKDLLF
jgi:hypothetical protein